MRVLLAAALAGGLAAAWSGAIAQPIPPTATAPSTIRVTGQAQVSEAPDRVYIDIGVTTRAQKSDAAAAENAKRLAAVIGASKRAAGADAELTTAEYSINPNYHYSRDGGTPTIVGYTASNVVRVRLDDLGRIGRVIDAATEAGSNNIQDIRFALRDEQTARSEALREAALNARQDAGALAAALGLKIVRVLSVDEQSPATMPRPIHPMFKRSLEAAPAAAPTPVEAGTIDVDATVTLTVEVAPAKR